jgi:hypothetical protein
MLGFARLVEKNLIDLQGIISSNRPLSLNWDNINDFLEKFKNPLTHAFSSFHYSLKWKIWQAKMRHPITAITFSDSAGIGVGGIGVGA